MDWLSEAPPPTRSAPTRRRRAAHAAGAWLLCAALGCAPAGHHAPPRPALPLDRFYDLALACDADGVATLAAIEKVGFGAQVFVASSADRGESWNVVPPFGREQPGGRRHPQIATGAPGEAYLMWVDARHGPVDVLFNRSRDGGSSWLPEDLRVNTNPPAGSRLVAPAIACDDRGNVYVVWLDDREGFEAVYANHSRDGGQSWETSDRRVTNISLGRKASPRLACDGSGDVFVVWMELRDGARRVFVNGSTDYGLTWMPQDIQLSDGSTAIGPDLCVLESGVVFVAWLESARGTIETSRSTDRGRFWSPPRSAVPQERGLAAVSVPRVLGDHRSQIYVAWHGVAPDGGSRLQLQASNDGGDRFTTTTLSRSYRIGAIGLEHDWEGPAAPFSMTTDAIGNVYFAWVEQPAGIAAIGFDRVTDFGRTWMRIGEGPVIGGHAPIDATPPGLAVDAAGHVCVLWNEGSNLHVAASPFYGDSGWRHTDF